MSRKIIQIQTTEKDEVIALCDDGTLWVSKDMGWIKVPSIPQEDNDEH